MNDILQDRFTAVAKVAETEYQLEQLKANADFYATIRNFFLALIIVVLLEKLKLINGILSYIIAGLIAFATVMYLISTMNYNENQRSTTNYNETYWK
jgi:L-lactate permease